MASLRKFKLLATQCTTTTTAGTPSPSRSPVVHLRRRKTLRMLFHRANATSTTIVTTAAATSSRRRLSRRDGDGGGENCGGSSEKMNVSRCKLKDLLLSSPPPMDDNMDEDEERDELLPATIGSFSGEGVNWGRRGGVGGGSFRSLSSVFRNRILRRAWRPVLVSIPE